jgi:hypothetical protein
VVAATEDKGPDGGKRLAAQRAAHMDESRVGGQRKSQCCRDQKSICGGGGIKQLDLPATCAFGDPQG